MASASETKWTPEQIAVRNALEAGRHGWTEESECPDCDGFGCHWNNGDRSSGQWAPCESCGDTRGHP